MEQEYKRRIYSVFSDNASILPPSSSPKKNDDELTLVTRDHCDLVNIVHVLMVWLSKTCRFKMKKKQSTKNVY